jgi:hypothetical protein
MDHAEFARRMAETSQRLRQTQQQLALSARPGADIQTLVAPAQRLVRRVQVFACVMLGLSLLFAGYVVWQHVTQGTEHAALTQALRTETQTLATTLDALKAWLERGNGR